MKMYIENLSIGAVIWLSMIPKFMEMVSVVLVVVRDDDLIEGDIPLNCKKLWTDIIS